MEKVGTDSAFTARRSVGEVARELFDPEGLGRLVDVGALGVVGHKRSSDFLPDV